MVNRRRLYARARRSIEDLLLDWIADPCEETWRRISLAGESIPEMKTLQVPVRTVLQEPAPGEPCIVLVESFGSIRHSVPQEIVVYATGPVEEGELGIRQLYLSRLPEV